MPDAGPVVPADNAVQNPPQVGVERVAQLPQEGDSPQNIVSGFLQAMTAYPVNLPVVRQFLTTDEQDAWDPTRRTLTYRRAEQPDGHGTPRSRCASTTPSGSTSAAPGAASAATAGPGCSFTVTEENDEWRIASAPDAFVDPERLVPGPLHPEAGSTTSTRPRASSCPSRSSSRPTSSPAPSSRPCSTVPVRELAEVVRTFVPQGLTPGLSVPVDDERRGHHRPRGRSPPGSRPRRPSCWSTSSPGRCKQVPELTGLPHHHRGRAGHHAGRQQQPVQRGPRLGVRPHGRAGEQPAVRRRQRVAARPATPTGLQPVTGPLGSLRAASSRSASTSTRSGRPRSPTAARRWSSPP